MTGKQLKDLSNFVAEEILRNNVHAKKIIILGHFKSDGQQVPSIVMLEKTAFTPEDVYTGNKLYITGNDDTINVFESDANVRKLFNAESKLDEVFVNDIYAEYFCFPKAQDNSKFHNFFVVLFLSNRCFPLQSSISPLFIFFPLCLLLESFHLTKTQN